MPVMCLVAHTVPQLQQQHSQYQQQPASLQPISLATDGQPFELSQLVNVLPSPEAVNRSSQQLNCPLAKGWSAVLSTSWQTLHLPSMEAVANPWLGPEFYGSAFRQNHALTSKPCHPHTSPYNKSERRCHTHYL